MTETPSPLENLAACAVAYLAGILFTLALISYIEAALSSERHRRDSAPEAFPPPLES
jgi:hypothetical protein